MKILIASDIHGSAKYCGMLAEAFAREGAERLILLGDVLYHGPRNPLPEGYAPAEVARILNGLKEKIICVRGNCDSEVDQMVLSFPVLSDYGAVFADGRALYLAHGHKEAPPMPCGSAYLTGHTHVPLNALRDGVLHLNPGSVSLPKDGAQTRGYILYDRGAFSFRTLDGTVYDEAVLG